MRDYIKPYIEDESIEIEDICTISNGPKNDPFDVMTDNPEGEDL